MGSTLKYDSFEAIYCVFIIDAKYNYLFIDETRFSYEIKYDLLFVVATKYDHIFIIQAYYIYFPNIRFNIMLYLIIIQNKNKKLQAICLDFI